MNYLGIDLAWGEGSTARAAKETGVTLLASDGTILDAGWTVGIAATVDWVVQHAAPGDVIAIDAPLIVANERGMRDCEREVGQRYGRWRVAANATNLSRAWLGGVTLRTTLEAHGIELDDGVTLPTPGATTMFECYPYTALVGASEFGYDIERPRYKRPNRSLAPGDRRAARAAACDLLVERFEAVGRGHPPISLRSHPATAQLVETPAPLADREYKHREDLLDSALCAWTAALWATHGLERCQVLGATSTPDARGRRATIIAPARPAQRR